ncbi:MAG: hypothetical protein HN948_06880 [Clostridia bacterium]|jgi:hypothetical protein|nr:hypothetical protein [Clostridia bacterium]
MTNQTNQQDKFMTEYLAGRKQAMTGGTIVYVGVIVLTTALFITFILTAFPADAYLIRVIMTVGGIMVGGSALAFPVTLHKWAISGSHRTWATWLYYGEIAIIGVNTLVSFSVLLATYAGWIIPEWVSLIEPFTILAIVYTLFAWGTVFQTDPLAQAQAKKLANLQALETMVADRIGEYLHTAEGEDKIREHADEQIAQMMSVDRYKQRTWGTNGHKQQKTYAAESPKARAGENIE